MKLEEIKKKYAWHNKLEPCKCYMCKLIRIIDSHDERVDGLLKERDHEVDNAYSLTIILEAKQTQLTAAEERVKVLERCEAGCEAEARWCTTCYDALMSERNMEKDNCETAEDEVKMLREGIDLALEKFNNKSQSEEVRIITCIVELKALASSGEEGK